ncbi:MAG: hypothetical protein FK733_15005 [Asgard group archaeon]|nr:hypothetical protein [Asgard group archaeon]
MKKTTRFLILIFISGMFICTTFVKGDYAVTVGQIFTYKVEESEWKVKEGSLSADTTGYRINDDTFSPDSNFAVLVTGVVPTTSVSYNMTAGTTTFSGSNVFADLNNIKQFCLYPNFIAGGGFTSSWNQAQMDNGPSIIRWFFSNIGEAYIFSTLRDLADEAVISEFTTTAGYTQTSVQGYFDESSAIAVFDWIYEGTIQGSLPNTEIEGYELFKFAFDKSTGVMKGYRIEIDLKGIVEGVDYEFYMYQEVEILGYDLPAFFYTQSGGGFIQFLSDYKWYFIGIGGGLLVTIIIISVMIRVRKKKKKK